MKGRTLIVAGVLGCAAAATAHAQSGPQQVGLALGLQRNYETVKANLTYAAGAMPEENYGFKLVPVDEVRTYGQWFGHQADNQLGTCATLKGVPNPSQGAPNERKWTTKAEFVHALADAFAFCDGAFAALTDENVHQMVQQGQGQTARGVLVTALLAHALETNGIVTLYLRAKGIAPPAPAGGRGGRGRGGRGAP